MEVQRSSSSYYNPTRKFISIEGSLLVSDSTMIFTAQKISFSRFDITTSTYSEPYQTFTRGKDNIDSMLSGFIFATAGHKTQYHIEQGKLSIAVDYNENGDFSDDHGAFLYTRQ
ncbi:hypothetical protein [uncultured Sunxiuqinia sp.]|uniref:hypothetical protein n=1 Tax=uncultured Sunxiuqinia sp. TaxID=1573825 RepID=UPI002AA764C1|nr:hypothetical protein [uncultured Sunxiuqinia sp.]